MRSPCILIRTSYIRNHSLERHTLNHEEPITDSIVIHIRDNGSGIIEAAKARLFDPFFTTKTVGKGTGLGLSISYRIIVEKHQGSLECFSKPGQGTEFVIKIPVRPTREKLAEHLASKDLNYSSQDKFERIPSSVLA
jgi:signal transduction histidine kinase